MPKAFTNTALFLLGVLLSGVMVSFAGGLRSRSIPAPASAPIAPRYQLKHSVDPQEEELRRTLSLGKGLQRLIDALHDSDPAQLRLVRSDFIHSIPNAESSILPSLRQHALDELLTRFSNEDWQDWPRSSFSVTGAPTIARSYVDSVLAVNRELGAFLETAAQLFHHLYRTTDQGQTYDLDQGIEHIIANAETLLPHQTDGLISPKLLLVSTLILDPLFIAPFERLRGQFVSEFVRKNPEKYEQHIRLFFSLKAQYCTPDVFSELNMLLRRLVKEASPGFREEVLTRESREQVLHSFASFDERVKSSLAQLYAVRAVDALESRDLVGAQDALDQSALLHPGLPARASVENFLRQLGVDSAARRMQVQARKAPVKREALEKKGETSNEEPVSPFVYWLLGGGAFAFVGFLLYSLAQKIRIARFASEESEHRPTESFSEWSLADIRSGYDPIPREEREQPPLRAANS